MNIVLFDEHEKVANKLGNILKEKLANVTIYTDLLHFLASFCYRQDFMSTVFVLSESVLKNRDTKVEQILRKFDSYNVILTYRIENAFCLKLNINYIYEYQVTNYKIFAEHVYKIEECFVEFASNKEYFISCNFQCEEIPIHLSNSKKNQEVHKLYKKVNTQKEINIMLGLTKTQTKLFKLLLSEKDGISLEEIAYNLWESKSKAQNVYTLMHTLKRIVSQKTDGKYQIIRYNKKYQLMMTTEASKNFSSLCGNTSITENLNNCSIIR